MLTSITIKGLKAYAYHGLFEEERSLGQKFTFDISAALRDVETHGEDELLSSVRYDAVVDEAMRIATTKTYQTLEALGEMIAVGLLGCFELIEFVEVSVSKTSPPIRHTIDEVGVQVSLSRKELGLRRFTVEMVPS
ncbi:MAG: dihydroneopterin aldolase [Phenylobacterium sp.]|jgi:dihydroneopterin aldolase|nr:dihydroneopterin aldolase [Phenylobacterium sp.]